MPISCAVVGSSAVARKARPIRVNERNSCSPASSTTATQNVISGNQPIDSRR